MLDPWKKSYDKPRQHSKKQRHHCADEGPYIQSYGFSSSHEWIHMSVAHKEGWALRMNAFELWCWRRLLRISWTAKRSNQSILKEIKSEYSMEGPMLKLKFQYFDHLMQRANSMEKTLMLESLRAGGEEGNRGWDDWMASPTQWIRIWANSKR